MQVVSSLERGQCGRLVCLVCKHRSDDRLWCPHCSDVNEGVVCLLPPPPFFGDHHRNAQDDACWFHLEQLTINALTISGESYIAALSMVTDLFERNCISYGSGTTTLSVDFSPCRESQVRPQSHNVDHTTVVWEEVDLARMFQVYRENIFTHGWRVNPKRISCYANACNHDATRRPNQAARGDFQPQVYFALQVGSAVFLPNNVPDPDGACIWTGALHVSLAYLGDLPKETVVDIISLAEKITKHISMNGMWPVQDAGTLRWYYKGECKNLHVLVTLGTCDSARRCKGCAHFLRTNRAAKPGEIPFDTHLHEGDNFLPPLACLQAGLCLDEAQCCFRLDNDSSLYTLCRNIQAFLRTHIEQKVECDWSRFFVRELHLIVAKAWMPEPPCTVS